MHCLYCVCSALSVPQWVRDVCVFSVSLCGSALQWMSHSAVAKKKSIGLFSQSLLSLLSFLSLSLSLSLSSFAFAFVKGAEPRAMRCLLPLCVALAAAVCVSGKQVGPGLTDAPFQGESITRLDGQWDLRSEDGKHSLKAEVRRGARANGGGGWGKQRVREVMRGER